MVRYGILKNGIEIDRAKVEVKLQLGEPKSVG